MKTETLKQAGITLMLLGVSYAFGFWFLNSFPVKSSPQSNPVQAENQDLIQEKRNYLNQLTQEVEDLKQVENAKQKQLDEMEQDYATMQEVEKCLNEGYGVFAWDEDERSRECLQVMVQWESMRGKYSTDMD